MKNLFTFLLIIAYTGTFAQQKINFSGDFAINKSKIDFGKAPDWILPSRIKVIQEGANLTIVRTTVNEAGAATDRTYIFAGNNPFEFTTTSGQKINSILQWNVDRTSFTINLTSIIANGQPGQQYKEIWSLFDNGKTLVIDRNVEQANGLNYNIKAFYDKNQ